LGSHCTVSGTWFWLSLSRGPAARRAAQVRGGVEGAETGSLPATKSWSYYKHSWTDGHPFKREASWEALDHVPPSRRDLVARPDLALSAMSRILTKVGAEIEVEQKLLTSQQEKRLLQMAKLKASHAQRHEAQRRLGVPGHSNKSFDALLESDTRVAESPTGPAAGAVAGSGAAEAAAAGTALGAAEEPLGGGAQAGERPAGQSVSFDPLLPHRTASRTPSPDACQGRAARSASPSGTSPPLLLHRSGSPEGGEAPEPQQLARDLQRGAKIRDDGGWRLTLHARQAQAPHREVEPTPAHASRYGQSPGASSPRAGGLRLVGLAGQREARGASPPRVDLCAGRMHLRFCCSDVTHAYS